AAAKALASTLRDTLFLFENGLVPAVLVRTPLNWDTHYFNLNRQQQCMAVAGPLLAAFLAELPRRRTPDGVPLSEQLGVVISSELGRFPFLNEFAGKDHLPELPAILLGPGLQRGQYGDTDRSMLSSPVSLRTGHPVASPRDVVPTLDDLGATVLAWFGIDDARSLGYIGRRLDFLLT